MRHVHLLEDITYQLSTETQLLTCLSQVTAKSFKLNNDTDELCWKKDSESSVNFTVSPKEQHGMIIKKYTDTASFAPCPANSLRIPLHDQLLGTVNYT